MKAHPLRTWREGGFTLVELMVALALAAVISVSIMIIANGARETYELTTRKVEVYSKFRLALLSLERDFSGWIPTSDLEFFVDGRGAGSRRNEHWDQGEELPDTRDERGSGVVDGGAPRDYDEFAYILERHYVGMEPDGSRKVHDAYQAYFRTMTYIDGLTREANVEYMLLDPHRLDRFGVPQPPTEVGAEHMRDLTLYKIVRYHEFSYGEIQKPSTNFPIRRRLVEVCPNITDFRLEYTTYNRFDNDVNPAFRTPSEDQKEQAEPATSPREVPDATAVGGKVLKKVFGYGSSKIKDMQDFDLAIAYRPIRGDRQGPRSDHRPIRFGWERNPRIQFAELTPGDQIFIYTEATGRGQGPAAQVGVAGNVSALTQFPAGTYTVKTNISGKLEFREDIETSSLMDRDTPGVRYKAAFLPDSIRITLRVVDESRGEEPKTFQRVVWVRQKAR